jgi:hypothetical protein
MLHARKLSVCDKLRMMKAAGMIACPESHLFFSVCCVLFIKPKNLDINDLILTSLAIKLERYDR